MPDQTRVITFRAPRSLYDAIQAAAKRQIMPDGKPISMGQFIRRLLAINAGLNPASVETPQERYRFSGARQPRKRGAGKGLRKKGGEA